MSPSTLLLLLVIYSIILSLIYILLTVDLSLEQILNKFQDVCVMIFTIFVFSPVI